MSAVNLYFAEAILKNRNVYSTPNMRPGRSAIVATNQYQGGTGPIFETG